MLTPKISTDWRNFSLVSHTGEKSRRNLVTMTKVANQNLGGDPMDHDHGSNGGRPRGDAPKKPDPNKDKKR